MSADDPQKTTITGIVKKKDMGGVSKSAHHGHDLGGDRLS